MITPKKMNEIELDAFFLKIEAELRYKYTTFISLQIRRYYKIRKNKSMNKVGIGMKTESMQL